LYDTAALVYWRTAAGVPCVAPAPLGLDARRR
jgi:hypothetical protein